MSVVGRPRLRRVESFPVNQPDGQVAFALRDPEGFSPSIVIPYAAAVLASLMDGTRSLEEVCGEFRRRHGQGVALGDVEQLVRDLDDRWYFDNPRYRSRWKAEIERYLNSPQRPAAHAGRAYADQEEALRAQLAALFQAPRGPGPPCPTGEVRRTGLGGILSPHVDLHRGGPAFAWAYKRLVEESGADIFVVFGTAHCPLNCRFSLTRKSFATPLGSVEVEGDFVGELAARLAATGRGGNLNLFADELAHRHEHSIEFQAVWLQYLLGPRRRFFLVPVLVGSFHDLIARGVSPGESPEIEAFVDALRATAGHYAGRVCYISGADLAHIGQRYGDRAFLSAARLEAQAVDDRALLDHACRADAEGFYRHVQANGDRFRICGLAPTYTLLRVLRPARGELLKYDQAADLDGTACVSFASAAFYDAKAAPAASAAT